MDNTAGRIPWQTLHEPLRRVLQCLDVENSRLVTYFQPLEGAALLPALRDHLMRLRGVAEEDVRSKRMAAAGLLALGELQWVDEILASAPEYAVRLDHGAGWCGVVASSTVAAVLPLPVGYPSPASWLRGSEELAAVERWIAENRRRLKWDGASGQFLLAGELHSLQG